MMKNRLRGRNLIFRFLFANIGSAGFRLLAFPLPSSVLLIFQGFDGFLATYRAFVVVKLEFTQPVSRFKTFT